MLLQLYGLNLSCPQMTFCESLAFPERNMNIIKIQERDVLLNSYVQTQRTISQDCIMIFMSRHIPEISSQVYLDA